MGISILFVLFCHAKIDGTDFPGPVLSALSFLDIGVDMFFLFSGIGIFFSIFNAQTKGTYTYSSFIVKRLKRILIPYLILETPFWIWYCVQNGDSPFFSLYYLSFASFWIEHIGLWFVALLLPLYFASPFIYRLIRKNELWTLVLLLLPLIISVLPNVEDGSPYVDIFSNIQFVSARIPCFVIGLWLGKKVMDNESVSIVWFAVLLALFFALKYIPIINSIYRGWMIAIIMSAVLSQLLGYFNNVRCIQTPLTLLGKSTLYIYISYDVCKNLFVSLPLFGGTGTSFYFAAIFIGMLLGILYYYTDSVIKNKR